MFTHEQASNLGGYPAQRLARGISGSTIAAERLAASPTAFVSMVATEGAVTSTLVADQYVSATQTMVFDVSLRRRSGEWTVEEPLEGVSVRNP